MTLTDEQKATIAKWIEDGANVSDVQKRLKSDLEISMTYMETRFLVDDLKLNFKEPEVPVEPAKPEEPKEEEIPADPPGKVSVTMDQITRPGCMISGRVVFSDGEKAEWYLDQTGRLGLNPSTPSYRPKQEDVIEFQTELEKVVRGQGF